MGWRSAKKRGSHSMASAGFQDLLTFFFRAQGRIGRAEYGLGIAFIYAINFAILSFVIVHTDGEPGALVLATIAAIPLTIAFLVIVVKRCHDLGLPGTFVLLLFVPIVNLFWIVALLFVPGNAAPNLYGPPPLFRRD
jgi:uncharacterized membrane protein YhaH (DUF805 family)